MNLFIYSEKQKSINNKGFEVVETKGKGHPDNICDTLAERISANYSNYCIENYGFILRHMVDKLTILGGGSKVSFGNGEMKEPIRVLINGRFTDRYKDERIDYMSIVYKTIKDYFNELFPLLDTDKFLKIVDNIVVLENIETGEIIKEDRNNLPSSIREGNILEKKGGAFCIDSSSEEKRREIIKAKLDRLKALK